MMNCEQGCEWVAGQRGRAYPLTKTFGARHTGIPPLTHWKAVYGVQSASDCIPTLQRNIPECGRGRASANPRGGYARPHLLRRETGHGLLRLLRHRWVGHHLLRLGEHRRIHRLGHLFEASRRAQRCAGATETAMRWLPRGRGADTTAAPASSAPSPLVTSWTSCPGLPSLLQKHDIEQSAALPCPTLKLGTHGGALAARGSTWACRSGRAHCQGSSSLDSLRDGRRRKGSSLATMNVPRICLAPKLFAPVGILFYFFFFFFFFFFFLFFFL